MTNTLQQIERLNDRIADLESRLQSLSQLAQPHPAPDFRLAKVDHTGTPPADGQNFEMVFQNGTYNKAGGVANLPSYTPRISQKEWCSNLTGNVPPNGQEIVTFYFSGRWWTVTVTQPESLIRWVKAFDSPGQTDLTPISPNANCVFNGKLVTHNVQQNMCTAGLTEVEDVYFVRADQILNEDILHNVVYMAYKIGQHTEVGDTPPTRDLYALRGVGKGEGTTIRDIEIKHPTIPTFPKYAFFVGDGKCLFDGTVGNWSTATDTSYCSDSPFTTSGGDVWAFISNPVHKAILRHEAVYQGKLLGQYSADGGSTFRDLYSIVPDHYQYCGNIVGATYSLDFSTTPANLGLTLASTDFEPVEPADIGFSLDGTGTFTCTRAGTYEIHYSVAFDAVDETSDQNLFITFDLKGTRLLRSGGRIASGVYEFNSTPTQVKAATVDRTQLTDVAIIECQVGETFFIEADIIRSATAAPTIVVEIKSLTIIRV